MAVHSDSLVTLRHKVSRLLNDLLLGTVASAGSGTFVCALGGWEKPDDYFNNWVNVYCYAGNAASLGDYGNPTDWVNTTHTMTFAPAVTLVAADSVEVHRLFTVLEINAAINAAIEMVTEGKLIDKIDESIILNNLISNGTFETGTALTGWTDSTNAPTDSSRSSTHVFEGTYSALVVSDGTNANWIYQSVTDWAKYQGKSGVCKVKALSTTADRIRLAVYDGVDYTYSDYHDGTVPIILSVSPTISTEATELTVQLRTEAGAAVTSYWDRCWLAIDNLYEYDLSTDFLYVTKVELEGTESDRFDSVIDPRYYSILRESTPRLKFDKNLWGPLSGRKIRVTGLQKSGVLALDATTTAVSPVYITYQAAALLHQSKIRAKGDEHDEGMKLAQAVADRERRKIHTNIPADSKKVTK